MVPRSRGHRPSPALTISLLALVLSMAGTATAARVLITSSSQIQKGSVNSGDVKDEALRGRDLRDGTVGTDDLDRGLRGAIADAGTQAMEAFRKAGPESAEAGKLARVATLSNIPPGVYAIFAKTVITPEPPNTGLLRQGETVSAHCALDAGGDRDEARTFLGSPGALAPGELNVQITRTFGSTGTAALECKVEPSKWRASDTSIIAVRVGKAPRSAVQG